MDGSCRVQLLCARLLRQRKGEDRSQLCDEKDYSKLRWFMDNAEGCFRWKGGELALLGRLLGSKAQDLHLK